MAEEVNEERVRLSKSVDAVREDVNSLHRAFEMRMDDQR